MPTPLRVLELFCGIGGCAAALGPRAHVVSAVDINHTVLDIYRWNFPFPTVARTIESMPDADFHAGEVDGWWLSPPCQPYTRRGSQRDLADPRAAALLSMIDRIPRLRPSFVALENVPPFQASQACERLRNTLAQCGYRAREFVLCPTQLGVPNRRLRFYLVASQDALQPAALPRFAPQPLAAYLDPDPDPDLDLPEAVARNYAQAIDVVDAEDPDARAGCFTAAYGRSHVRSGSYLATPRGPRRFAPREILRLLGFPDAYRFPDHVTREQAWRHLGNSLSVVAVRHVLSVLPALRMNA